MNALVSITALASADNLTKDDLRKHEIHSLPVLVIFPHNRCNCRCMMCDIWQIRQAQQIHPADLEKHLPSFRDLGVRWTVFSGGEPQLNEQWSWLAQVFRALGSRVTLLTAGLLLKEQAQAIVKSIDDVIVSLDGPPAVHNRIRRVTDAFERMAEGVIMLRQLRPEIPVRARCTVQKENHSSLRQTVEAAKQIGLTSISFLAADVTSAAFNRNEGWPAERAHRVSLNPAEVDVLEHEIELLIVDQQNRFDGEYVVESPAKLRRIVHYFRALIGQAAHVAPRCNAPWVSAVIEASGDVRPCFFHPVIGNIHRHELAGVLNGPEAMKFRSKLDVANNPVCQRCVCSLYVPRE